MSTVISVKSQLLGQGEVLVVCCSLEFISVQQDLTSLLQTNIMDCFVF